MILDSKKSVVFFGGGTGLSRILKLAPFVFKTNAAENEQEAVVYSEDNPEEKV